MLAADSGRARDSSPKTRPNRAMAHRRNKVTETHAPLRRVSKQGPRGCPGQPGGPEAQGSKRHTSRQRGPDGHTAFGNLRGTRINFSANGLEESGTNNVLVRRPHEVFGGVGAEGTAMHSTSMGGKGVGLGGRAEIFTRSSMTTACHQFPRGGVRLPKS